MTTRGVGLAILLAGLGCGAPPAAPGLVLHNGHIFTADSAAPFVQALLIRGDRIVAAGTDSLVLGQAEGEGARRVDLGGRTVVPGFNDAHAHIGPELGGAQFATGTDPLPDPPFAVVRDSLRAVAGRVPAGTWISTLVGERVLSDGAARRLVLDSLAPGHPVALRAWSGHGLVLNTAALTALGLADWMRDPVGGRFERDVAGRVTGLLEEYAAYDLLPALMHGDDSARVRAAFERGAAELVTLGITSVQSIATAITPAALAAVMPALELPVRLRVIRFPLTTPDGAALDPWTALAGAGRVTVTGTKWILDGTPVERLAAARAPYADRAGWFGRVNFGPDALRALLQDALDRHDQPLIHAVGDSAIALVLRTMADLAPDSVWRARRPRIEHGDGMFPDLVPLAARLGVVVTQNPSHLALGPMAAARYGAGRMPGFQPLRSLLASGVPLALGSDGPLNPFLNLMLAVIHPDDPAEALTMEQAVTAYTAGSAYAEFAEEEKGRLAPGMLADLAVLSQDIFAVSPDRLPATRAVLTLVGGRPVHDPAGLLR